MLSDDANPQAFRTVVLRHETPDGGFHFDWMFEQPATEVPTPASLMTFRVNLRPDDTDCMSLPAERLADHRLHYLKYEGELTGNRGRVERVASGFVVFLEVPVTDGAVEMAFECQFDGEDLASRWSVSRVRGSDKDWVFLRAPK